MNLFVKYDHCLLTEALENQRIQWHQKDFRALQSKWFYFYQKIVSKMKISFGQQSLQINILSNEVDYCLSFNVYFLWSVILR
jgi:hypothetical protein